MVPKPQSWRELRDVLPFHYQQYEDCIPWCEQQFDALEKDPPDPVTRRAERVYMHALIEMYRLELMELANSTSGRSRNEASDLDQRNEQLRASGPGLDGNLAAENMASAGEGGGAAPATTPPQSPPETRIAETATAKYEVELARIVEETRLNRVLIEERKAARQQQERYDGEIAAAKSELEQTKAELEALDSTSST